METGWSSWGASWDYHRPTPDSCPAILPLHSARVPRPLSASCVAAAASMVATNDFWWHMHNSAGDADAKISFTGDFHTKNWEDTIQTKMCCLPSFFNSTALCNAACNLRLHEGFCHPRIPVVPTVPLRSPQVEETTGWGNSPHTENVWKIFHAVNKSIQQKMIVSFFPSQSSLQPHSYFPWVTFNILWKLSNFSASFTGPEHLSNSHQRHANSLWPRETTGQLGTLGGGSNLEKVKSATWNRSDPGNQIIFS